MLAEVAGGFFFMAAVHGFDLLIVLTPNVAELVPEFGIDAHFDAKKFLLVG